MTTLGKYDLHEQLGKGGFGTVYRATDTSLGRPVALKILHPQMAADAEFVERFRKEARLAAALESPHVVTIYEVGEQDGRYFIAMRYYPGGSLADLLKQGPLPWPKTTVILTQVCEGLQLLHAQGWVHRDLKPSNILFDAQGRAVVADFGLARALTTAGSSSSGGMGAGTPHYKAPELWRGKPPASPATDVYALGCILGEMLTGEMLFPGDTPDEVMTRHVLDGPDFGEDWPQVGVPEGVKDFIQRCLSKNPGDRPEDAAAFYRELRATGGALTDPLKEVKPPATMKESPPVEAPIEPQPVDGLALPVQTIPSVHSPVEPRITAVPVQETLPDEEALAVKRKPRMPAWAWALIAGFGGSFIVGGIVLFYFMGENIRGGISYNKWLATETALASITTPASAVEEQPVLVPTAVEVPTDLKTLRVNLGTYPDIIDPQKSSFVNEIAHLKMIYEGLTTLNAELETVPGAAESWEYNADATQLTFTLRKDLKYSDGSLLNAKRFEYSLLRNIDPVTAGEYAGITDEILGAPEWRTADTAAVSVEDLAKLKEAVGVKALDSKGAACTDYEQKDCTTLQITLSKPAPYFHTVMSLWVIFPAKEELITEGGETWWNDATYHIGNGPMVLSELDPSNRGFFTPNPYYWRGVAKVNLEFKYITDGAVAFEAYKNGEFDIISLAAEDLATVEADPVLNAEKMIYPGSCTYNLNFHHGKPPFDDPAVREAFAYSFDRAGWVKDVLKDFGSTTQTWISKGFPGYDPDETRFAYDPAKTIELLTAAGYTIEGGKLMKDGAPIDITLTFSDTPRNRTRYEWIAGKWKTDLGLDAALNPVESTTYTAISKDVETAPQTFILGWCADYPDPQNWLSVYWMSTSYFASRIAYVNPDLDAKLTEADVTLDADKRMALYAEAQEMLVGSTPGVFAWNNVNSYLVKPYVKGIKTTPQDSGWPGVIDPLSITIED